MGKKRKILIIIIIAAIVLTLAFILGNSLVPPTQSYENSGSLYDKFKPVLDALFGKDNFTHTHFRQSAHFIEYFILGGETALLYLAAFNLKKQRFVDLFSAGLFVAVIDESLQLISARGPEVVDVLTDYAGYLTAVIICIAIVFIIRAVKKNKIEKS